MPRPQAPGLPIRLFHGLFALGVVAAAAITLILGREHPLFRSHSTIGLALAGLVLLRILWGVAIAARAPGNSPAPRRPRRNPIAAAVSFAMLALVLALAASGLAMTRARVDAAQAHTFMAYALVAATGVHIAAVLAHRLRAKGRSREP